MEQNTKEDINIKYVLADYFINLENSAELQKRLLNVIKNAIDGVNEYNNDIDITDKTVEVFNKLTEIINSNSVSDNAIVSLNELTNKWKDKWLFFNGDEDGMQIIRIADIHYSSRNTIVFDGAVISISENQGSIEFNNVTDFEFTNCFYITYINDGLYNYEANHDFKYSNKWDDPKKIDAALSSRPIDSDYTTRILTDEDVKKIINASIFSEYGFIENIIRNNF